MSPVAQAILSNISKTISAFRTSITYKKIIQALLKDRKNSTK